MVNQLTGVEAAAFETRLAWADADGANALAWPDDVLAAAQAAAGELPDAPPPRPMVVALPAVFDAQALLTHLPRLGRVMGMRRPGHRGAARPHRALRRIAINHLFRAWP